MRLLEKAPGRRPSHASDVSADLRRIQLQLTDQAETKHFPRTVPFVRPRFRAIGATVGLVLLAAVALAVLPRSSLQDPSPPNSRETGNSGSIASNHGSLNVDSIEVTHFAHTSSGDVPQGLLGHTSFGALLGDRVQVGAKLSKSAHAFLIVFRPDGVADLCFPDRDDVPPPQTDEPRYPVSDSLAAYGLREGTGLWVFAVVASVEPLPAFRDWVQQRFGSKAIWTPLSTVPPSIVWRDHGAMNVEHLTAGIQAPLLRGKDEPLQGPAQTIKQLTELLRTEGQADAVAAIGFGVAPRDESETDK
jgi:hypothetical protein